MACVTYETILRRFDQERAGDTIPAVVCVELVRTLRRAADRDASNGAPPLLLGDRPIRLGELNGIRDALSKSAFDHFVRMYLREIVARVTRTRSCRALVDECLQFLPSDGQRLSLTVAFLASYPNEWYDRARPIVTARDLLLASGVVRDPYENDVASHDAYVEQQPSDRIVALLRTNPFARGDRNSDDDRYPCMVYTEKWYVLRDGVEDEAAAVDDPTILERTMCAGCVLVGKLELVARPLRVLRRTDSLVEIAGLFANDKSWCSICRRSLLFNLFPVVS